MFEDVRVSFFYRIPCFKDPPLAAATSPIPPAVASTANATGARPRLVAHRRARAAAAAAAVNAPPHLASSVSSVSPSKPYYFPRAPRTRPDGSESSTSGDGSLVEELEMEAAFIRPLGATRRQKVRIQTQSSLWSRHQRCPVDVRGAAQVRHVGVRQRGGRPSARHRTL